MLRKPRLRPKEGESPSEFRTRVIAELDAAPGRYFARQEIVRLEDEERTHRRDLLRIVSELETTYAHPDTPAPKSLSACRRYGPLCAFVDLCAGRATLEDIRARGSELGPEIEEPNNKISLW